MNSVESGKQILRNAEQSLQELLAQAAVNGDYAALNTLTYWAQQIAHLVDDSPQLAGTPSQKRSRPSPTKKLANKRKPASRKRSAGYPKFVRDEDHLVKIGWSKKDNEEYEHKAHRDAVRALVSSISRVGRKGKRFSMDSVLPLKKLDGEQVPDYQSYLILAWLRAIEVVTQHGRLGYTIAEEIDLIDSVDDCWERLACRAHSESEGL